MAASIRTAILRTSNKDVGLLRGEYLVTVGGWLATDTYQGTDRAPRLQLQLVASHMISLRARSWKWFIVQGQRWTGYSCSQLITNSRFALPVFLRI
jgi:hypothetical protein